MEKPIIFIVDDEEACRRIIVRLLKNMDLEIHTFASGVDALADNRLMKASLVISDNQMPAMSGSEFLGHVRALRPDVATLMVTGGPVSDQIESGIESGVINKLVKKPWATGELTETIRSLLKGAIGT